MKNGTGYRGIQRIKNLTGNACPPAILASIGLYPLLSVGFFVFWRGNG